MPYLLEISAIGNVGEKPVINKTGKGTSVTTFPVAINKPGETTWVRVTAWGKLAEECEKLTKGSLIYVKGIPGSVAWTKDDGQISSQVSITAVFIQFLRIR